ncbi:MAG: glycogen-binding domain-containing protein [Deltaproteobacteria bacterium]|nr:glycogen-binding domain-containing protein [Deltaproteobacteria bacterium]
MDYWISLFIDDEMDLDEKIDFVEKIHADGVFKEESLTLLRQEKKLRSPVADKVPAFEESLAGSLSGKSPPSERRSLFAFGPWFRPLAGWAAAAAILALFVFANMSSEPSAGLTRNRFIIYEPEMAQVEISGTFTSWQRIPMRPVGVSGYWEARLALPAGEHRYFYVLDGRRQVADPTVQTREKDDFGGENTVLNVEHSI